MTFIEAIGRKNSVVKCINDIGKCKAGNIYFCANSSMQNGSYAFWLRDSVTGNELGDWYSCSNFEPVNKRINIQKGGKMETIKNYLKKNSETFITIAIVLLVDEFVFGGALREKIKALLERVLGAASKKLEG